MISSKEIEWVQEEDKWLVKEDVGKKKILRETLGFLCRLELNEQ